MKTIGILGILIASFGSLSGAEQRPMTALDLWKLKRVGSPSISPDGKWCVVDVTTWDIEKDDSSSNLWLLSTDGKEQKQLTQGQYKNSGPKWSPDGKWIAFTSKRGNDDGSQIYVIPSTGGEARRVSNMAMSPSALKWSGDSQSLFCIAWSWVDAKDDDAYRQKDKAMKDNKVKAFIIDDATYRYWDKWIADGKRPLIYQVDVAKGTHRNLLWGTGKHLPPYEPSASDYDVSPDGKELCFVSENVKAIGMDSNNDLFTVSLGEKPTLTNITLDNDASDGSPAYSADGKKLAFIRQTIKFFYADRQRLMVMDRASGERKELTVKLDRSCTNPKWVDANRISVEVEDAGYIRVAFVNSQNGSIFKEETLVSERSIDFAKTDRAAVFVRSSFDLPPTIYSHRPGEAAPKKIEQFNDEITSQWKLGKVESMMFKGADNEEVQQWIVYPPNFDPKKKWPMVQVVHGGPHNGIMSDFSFRWNLQLWAAQGWVIGCVNFHGSSGFGQKFCDSITGDYGTKPTIDVLKSTTWFLEQPWIDKDRVATAGASYGGYMMAYLNGHTDVFRAMVCHAGVYSYHSQMASDSVRGRERALGAFPWGDLSKIDKQSAQRYAANFKTPTLVIHGEKDYRVPVTQGLEYYNTLKQKGIPARLIYFPDENHWILKAQNSLLWHKEVFAWIEKYIGKGTK